MLKFIKKKIKDKKGLNSIEMVIGSLIVITLFAGMTDFIKISNRMQSISSTISYISKVLSNQGCLANNPESVYVKPDGTQYYNISYIKNQKYIDSRTLFNTISRIMQSDGIGNDEWRIFIDGQPLTQDTKTKVFDFRERIPVEVQIDYRWGTLSNLLPIGGDVLSGTLTSSQEIVSTYRIREAGSDAGFEYNG